MPPRQDFASLGRTISWGMRCTVFVAIPATVGLLLISRPVVAVILERGEFTRADSAATAVTLSFYVLGLTGYFAQQILTRAFYSLQESSVPARTALIAVGISLVLNLVLVWPLGSGGLAAATAVCSYIQVAMLAMALRRRLGPDVLAGIGRALRDTAIATVCMAVAVGGVQYLMAHSSRILSLGFSVLAGTLVFGAVAWALRIEMLSLFLGKAPCGGLAGGAKYVQGGVCGECPESVRGFETEHPREHQPHRILQDPVFLGTQGGFSTHARSVRGGSRLACCLHRCLGEEDANRSSP